MFTQEGKLLQRCLLAQWKVCVYSILERVLAHKEMCVYSILGRVSAYKEVCVYSILGRVLEHKEVWGYYSELRKVPMFSSIENIMIKHLLECAYITARFKYYKTPFLFCNIQSLQLS